MNAGEQDTKKAVDLEIRSGNNVTMLARSVNLGPNRVFNYSLGYRRKKKYLITVANSNSRVRSILASEADTLSDDHWLR